MNLCQGGTVHSHVVHDVLFLQGSKLLSANEAMDDDHSDDEDSDDEGGDDVDSDADVGEDGDDGSDWSDDGEDDDGPHPHKIGQGKVQPQVRVVLVDKDEAYGKHTTAWDVCNTCWRHIRVVCLSCASSAACLCAKLHEWIGPGSRLDMEWCMCGVRACGRRRWRARAGVCGGGRCLRLTRLTWQGGLRTKTTARERTHRCVCAGWGGPPCAVDASAVLILGTNWETGRNPLPWNHGDTPVTPHHVHSIHTPRRQP